MDERKDAASLRAVAGKYRDMARQMSLRASACLLQEMAEEYEAEARALEAQARPSDSGDSHG